MGRELEIKRRQLSTHPQHSIRSRQCSAMEGSTEQSSQKEGVRRLVPSVPNEQVEMLKTNVGRLKICKRHIVPTTVLSSGLSSSGSKGVASRLKLVRPNRVLGGQSIFEQNGKQKVSIKEKISQSVVPLNSNQFSKGEDGRWKKLDQPTKKLSISNLRTIQTTNKITKEKLQQSYQKDPQGLVSSDRGEEDNENEGSVQEEYDDLGDQEKEKDMVEIVEQKKIDRKIYKEEQFKGNKQVQSASVKNVVQNKANSQINNTKPLNVSSSSSSNTKQQSVTGAQSTSSNNNNNSNNNSSNQVQKQPPSSSTDQSTLFVVAVNNLPRKCTESDIRSLVSSEKKDLVEVVLEEGDSYDCLLYFTTERSQLRTVKLLDNKKYEGQILRADPAEVIIEKQEEKQEESQREIEEENEEQVQEEYNDDNEEYREEDRYVEEIRQQNIQNSRIQQSEQQSKNLISSHIRSNEQTRSDNSSQQNQSSNAKRTSQVIEASRSSRLVGQSSQQQQQQEIASRKPREIEQQEIRNVRNNDIQQNQQQQSRQVKNAKKEQQQQQQRDSPSRSRDRTTGRYNNNNNNNNNDQIRGVSHERSSAGREEDISESRSNSGRNRSDSGNNMNRNRRSPSPRYNSINKKGDSRQPNIIKRSRYPASPVRNRDASPPRDRRNSGNVRERREITNERPRDSKNERSERDNTQRKYSRERNSRRRESPRRDEYSRR